MFLSDYHFHLISITRPLAVGAQTTQHKHTFYELGLLLSGEAIWRLEGHGDVRLVADEALLIAPEQLHSERVIKASAFAWLGFRAPEGALEGIPRYKPLPLGEWETPLRATLETLRIENACRPLEHEARMRLLLVDLLIQLRRAVHGEPLPQPTGEMHDNIEAARFYLERNATEELTMEQVARYHGFSLSHFEVLFAKRFGCTPKQYQHGIKLRRVEKKHPQWHQKPETARRRAWLSRCGLFLPMV